MTLRVRGRRNLLNRTPKLSDAIPRTARHGGAVANWRPNSATRRSLPCSESGASTAGLRDGGGPRVGDTFAVRRGIGTNEFRELFLHCLLPCERLHCRRWTPVVYINLLQSPQSGMSGRQLLAGSSSSRPHLEAVARAKRSRGEEEKPPGQHLDGRAERSALRSISMPSRNNVAWLSRQR